MAEFEELRISVKVADEASGQLGALKQGMDRLGGLDVTRKLEGIHKQVSGIEQELKKLMLNFATGGPSITGLVNFAKSIGPIGLAAVAVYETLKVTVGALKRQAEDLLNMATMAKRVGESTAQYIKTMEVWERSNVPLERAGEQWERFVDTMNHLRRMDPEGRETWQSLLTGLRGDQARRAEERLREIIAMPTNEQAANALKKFFDDVGRYYARQSDLEERRKGPEEQRKLLRTFGLTDLDRVREAFTIVSEQEAADMDRMVAAAQEFNEVSVRIEQNWHRIMQAMATKIMEGPLGPVLRAVEKVLGAEAKRLEGSQAPWWWELLGYNPAGIVLKGIGQATGTDPWGALYPGNWPTGAEQAPGAPGNMAVPLMSTEFAEGARKQLGLEDELIQQLKRFNDLLAGDEKAAGGGAAASLGIDDISTGKTRSPAGFVNNDLSESAFNRLFRGGKFEGQYQTVVNAAHSQGLSPSLVASIIAFETGYGRAKGAQKALAANNPAGLMAGTTRANKEFRQFDTIEEGIQAAAETQKRIYTQGGETIPGMGAIYAPVGEGGKAVANDPHGTNKQWPSSVARLQEQMKGPGGFAVRAREARAGREAVGAMASLTSTSRLSLMGTDMTPEEYSAAAPDLGPSASGRAMPFPTDMQMAGAISSMTPWASVRSFQHLQRLMGTAKSVTEPPQVLPRPDPRRELIGESRRDLDRGLAAESNIEPRGNLNVNVKAPNGTSVKADGDGMFKGNVSLERQMELPTLQ